MSNANLDGIGDSTRTNPIDILDGITTVMSYIGDAFERMKFFFQI